MVARVRAIDTTSVHKSSANNFY